MDFEKINYILSILLTTVGFIIGCAILLLSVPNQNRIGAKSYRTARIAMGIGYILMGLFMLCEISLFAIFAIGDDLKRILILITASFLALLFTSSSIYLVDAKLWSIRKTLNEMIPMCIIGTINIAAYFTLPESLFRILLVAFCLYYLFILIKYTLHFYKIFKAYAKERSSCLSDSEKMKLRWIKFSFYYAMLVALLVFVSLVNVMTGFVFFKIFITPFYIYYGFFLVDYGFKFHSTSLSPDTDNTISRSELSADSASEELSKYDLLKPLLDEWVSNKKYLNAGITIEQLAAELNINRTYLSRYINNCKGITFREWINSMRIEEAKMLFINCPELSASQIGKMTGFPDKSNFTRQFIKATGMSPKVWKKQEISTRQ